jgi:hypothetical protein
MPEDNDLRQALINELTKINMGLMMLETAPHRLQNENDFLKLRLQRISELVHGKENQ